MNLNNVTRITIILLILTTSCASLQKGGRPHGSHAPPVTGAEPMDTATRSASHALVEDGNHAHAYGQEDKAADLYLEAIKLDPNNGEAYFYLAEIKIKKEKWEEAVGLIEKSEYLFSADADWMNRIQVLREQL